jgi:GT2 family glycosyltransferase/glycosyltransferase involved in cell wall biosynthesis
MVGDSLCRIVDELRAISAHIVLIDDSPGHKDHSEAVVNLAARLGGHVGVEVIVNDRNVGFVKSTNRGLALACRRGDHALLLNSDTVVFPGAITEMLAGLEFDTMAGFVCPRTNNATICSLPPLDVRLPRQGEGPPAEHALRHADIARHLPRFAYVPTAVGFCMLVRWNVLANFGLLDEAYGLGYDEENDLVMRANRLGYRSLLANRAFVYHEGTGSFVEAAKAELQARNSRVLQSRYPEYMSGVHQHFASPQARGETILSERSLRSAQGTTVELALDARMLSKIVHGTSKAICRTAEGLARLARGSNVRIAVICSVDVARHHGLDLIEGLTIIPEAEAYGFDILLKSGQPFSAQEFWDNSRRAVRIVYTMLDTIAWDCLYLRTPELDALWRTVADLADGILFISPFSQSQFHKRFPVSPQVRTLVAELSLDAADYAPAGVDGSYAGAFQHGRREILVFGNHFHHKFVSPTAHYLADNFPDRRIVMFGIGESAGARNVVAIASGTLSDLELEALYSTASCVVYPSTYEGFGLPIVESLARGLTVYVRESVLNRWIDEHWNGPGRLVYYATQEELVQRLRENELTSGYLDSADVGPPSGGFPPNGLSWDDIASRAWDFLRELTEDDSNGQFWRRLDHQHRLNSYLAVNATAHAQHRRSSPAAGIAVAGPQRHRRTPGEFIRDLPTKTVKEIRRFIRRRRERRAAR